MNMLGLLCSKTLIESVNTFLKIYKVLAKKLKKLK